MIPLFVSTSASWRLRPLKRLVRFAVLGVLAGACLAAEDPMPLHEELPSAVIAYAVIPSLPTLLNHVQSIAGRFRTLAVGRLASVASQILGDTGFSHLDPTRPLVVALLSSNADTTPLVAAWIPTTDDSGTYERSARIWGMSAHVVKTVTVVAATEDDLARCGELMGFYRMLCAAPITADMRVHCACDRAWLVYGDALREQAWLAASRLSYLPQPPGAPDFVPALRVGLAGVIAVVQDLQDLGLDIHCDDTSVQATIDGVAQPGSALASVLVAPPALPDAGAVLGPGSGITTVVGHLDPHAVAAFATVFLQRVALQQELTLNDTLVHALADYGAGTNGTFALRISPDAVHGVELHYVHGVDSAASGLAFAQRMAAHFLPASAHDALGNELQLPLSVALQPEPSRNQIQIQHLAIALTHSSLSAEAQTAIGAYCRDGEIAFTPAWTLCVQDQADLESLIARATAAHLVPTNVTLAQSVFAPGNDLYLDSDLVGMVLASVAITNPTASGSSENLHSALAKHQEREPLIMAGRYAQGAMRWHLRMPLAPLSALRDAAREALAVVAPAVLAPVRATTAGHDQR